MAELTYLQAIILGLIQGVAEFLPISSSGHLAVVQAWLRLDPDSQSMLLFDVAAHLATVAAVLVVFAASVREFFAALASETTSSPASGLPPAGDRTHAARNRVALRLVWLMILAGIPTGAIGLGFKDSLEAAFGKPHWIGASLIATGVILAITAFIPRGRRGWRQFRWWHALLIGLAQGISILPGISRSGATICTALFCGVMRRRAAQFSFLIAVPAIVAATAVKAIDIVRLEPEEAMAIPWGPIAAGCLVSFVTGVVSLILLLRVVRMSKLHYFAPYCVLMGVWILSRSAG